MKYQDFYGIYFLPISLEFDRVGIQEIPNLKIGMLELESITEKIKKL